jgi:hypothetical protein
MNDYHHKIFLSCIKDITMDRFPQFVGICFNPSEYADILDITFSRLMYYYAIHDTRMIIKYMDFILLLRTRKGKKYYNKELYELLKNE